LFSFYLVHFDIHHAIPNPCDFASWKTKGDVMKNVHAVLLHAVNVDWLGINKSYRFLKDEDE